MRAFLITASTGLALATLALADTGVMATRPGLMCTSADALRKLTLPGGGSRLGSAGEQPGDAALKAMGGCIDIPQGATMFASSLRKQTSVIAFDAADSRGERRFSIPTADLRPTGSPDARDPML